MPKSPQVQAAGGVVWRRRDGDEGGELAVAVVHRPRYDDWSLPKGKLDRGETFEQAALREVLEETGLRCSLGAELEPTTYRNGRGRLKLVRYWLMEPIEGVFSPNEEVDELRWLGLDQAAALMSYPHDAALLREAGRRIAET